MKPLGQITLPPSKALTNFFREMSLSTVRDATYFVEDVISMIVRTVNLTGIYAGNVRNIVAGYLRSVSNGYQSAVCSGAPSSFYDNSVCTNYGDALYNPMWTILVVAGGASMLALLVMFILAVWVLSREQGNAEMRAIAKAIQIGAGAFLHREYAYLSAFVFVVTILLVLFLDWTTAICFICGASMSALTGYWGMWIAVRANVRLFGQVACNNVSFCWCCI